MQYVLPTHNDQIPCYLIYIEIFTITFIITAVSVIVAIIVVVNTSFLPHLAGDTGTHNVVVVVVVTHHFLRSYIRIWCL